MSMFDTDWIWTPDWHAEDEEEPRIVYFRKTLFLSGSVPGVYPVSVSADSRYKLYVNGRFVQEGPQKALSLAEWFEDSADLAPFLVCGENVVAVEVLRYPAGKPGQNNFNASLLRSETPGFYLRDLREGEDTLSGRNGWKCLVDRGRKVVGEAFLAGPAPIHAQEDVTEDPFLAGWKQTGYPDDAWQPCVTRTILDSFFAGAPYKLTKRTIPPMRHTKRRFEEVVTVREYRTGMRLEEGTLRKISAGNEAENGSGKEPENEPQEKEKTKPENAREKEAEKEPENALEKVTFSKAFTDMLHGEGTVVIPPHSHIAIDVSAGAENCGYMELDLQQGTGSCLRLLYAECYAYHQPLVTNPFGTTVEPAPKKGDRTDFVNGDLIGPVTTYRPAGFGTVRIPERYEPFWFSTFRYVRLTVETGEEPLVISHFGYRETGYPLEVKTEWEIPDPEIRRIWDISVRTLRLCMHETYMDCPFYEQMQYAMDSRTEILYTYSISMDDRLARNCMEAFRLCQRPDGLINADAPSRQTGVIPGFSLFYILMVHDHMMYFADEKLVRLHLPAIDRILSFFDGHIGENGMVEKLGGGQLLGPFWSFIDWVPEWDGGVPQASREKSGSLTMESLYYLYGLQKAAELCDFVGRKDTAEEYRMRAGRLKEAVRQCCTGMVKELPPEESAGGITQIENGLPGVTAAESAQAECLSGRQVLLLQDGPGVERYSVHCQVFGTLTGVLSAEEAREALQETVSNAAYPQGTVAFAFYVFRALEQCGLYQKTDRLWDPWRRMLENNLTTCVENETDARSDCHAWGALMCYELPVVMQGVRPIAPGVFEKGNIPQVHKMNDP